MFFSSPFSLLKPSAFPLRFLAGLVLALLPYSGLLMAQTAAPGPQVPAEVIEKRNAAGAINRPTNAEAPGRYSADHEAHRVAYNFQAPGIAILPLPGGRIRVWLSWYQQNNLPGGGAIGGGSVPHCVYAYCDDPFSKPDPVWTRVFYVDPLNERGGETASDPEVALLPDGRLLGSYITSGPGRDRKRSTYAFIIANPAATDGAFQLGQQHWLEYGVLAQPLETDAGTLAVMDEWGVARRFCRLEFPQATAADPTAIRAIRLSDIPWPDHPRLTSFFESSIHTVSGGCYRAYRRTKEGVYTTLSAPGGLTWGKEAKWQDFPSADSRNVFARSPASGHVIGAVNCSPEGPRYRTDLTLVLSENEGAPGSFSRALNIEPDDGGRKVAAQYPRLAFDQTGDVYCVYRWSDKRPGAPHHGASITVARVREDRLASGKATLADVEKRVACEVLPSK